jgi:hypothetical protein
MIKIYFPLVQTGDPKICADAIDGEIVGTRALAILTEVAYLAIKPRIIARSPSGLVLQALPAYSAS